MANKLIGIDSNIAGWVFRDNIPPSNTDELVNFQKSNDLINRLSQMGFQLLIPTIVLSELLCIFPESEQNARFAKFESISNIISPDFTFHTSRILSRILHQRYFTERKAYQQIEINKRGEKVTKAMMKYDSMILACAIERGASCFYTVDNGIHKYPKGFIDIKTLDEPPSGFENVGMFKTEE